MAFMKRETYEGLFYVVEAECGTDFIPADVCGTLADLEPGVIYSEDDACTNESVSIWQDWIGQVRDYAEGKEIQSIEARVGKLYRLSAPGYMDCTPWTTSASELD